MYRFWDYLDGLGHKLHFPQFIQNYICFKFDQALGVYDDEP